MDSRLGDAAEQKDEPERFGLCEFLKQLRIQPNLSSGYPCRYVTAKQMTPTLTHFLARLKRLGVSPKYEFVPSKFVGNSEASPLLVIPAKNDSVGRLTIYDDGDELTVEIGELHHTHFSAYNYAFESSEARLLAATEDAAQFVVDVLADRVLIAVDYADGRCIDSSHRYLNTDSPPTDLVRFPDAPLLYNEATRSKRYVWSGPVDAPDVT